MSTVASGAATMKIMSSTSITSMNGVTLISWTSFSASSPWSRRMTALSRVRRLGTPCRSLGGGRQCGAGRRGGGAIEIAADQREHLRRCVAKLRAVARDQARERVIDDHCRNRGGEPERGGEQRLGNAGRDYRQIGGMRLRYPDEAVHDAPNGAEQSDEGSGCADAGQHAGAAQDSPSVGRFDPLEPQPDPPLDAFRFRAGGTFLLRHSGLEEVPRLALGEPLHAFSGRALPGQRVQRRLHVPFGEEYLESLCKAHRPRDDRRKRQPNQHRLHHRVGIEIHPPWAEVARQFSVTNLEFYCDR